MRLECRHAGAAANSSWPFLCVTIELFNSCFHEFTIPNPKFSWRLWVEIEAHKWRDLELNLSKTVEGLSTYSSQQHEKAERQQKSSRVLFCSNLVPNHFTGLSVAPRSLADSVHWKKETQQKTVFVTFMHTISQEPRRHQNSSEVIWN